MNSKTVLFSGNHNEKELASRFRTPGKCGIQASEWPRSQAKGSPA